MSLNKLSGAKRRKIMKEKNEKESAVLKKTPKLDCFLVHPCSQSGRSNTTISSDFNKKLEELSVPRDETHNLGDFGITPSNSGNVTLVEQTENYRADHSTTSKSCLEIDIIDFGDPATWTTRSSEHADLILRNLSKKNADPSDFSTSKRLYGTKERYCTAQMFLQKMPNGETRTREWLLYSKTSGSVYCLPCKLFSKSSNNFTTGFNDWKNHGRLGEHERSNEHRESTKQFVLRSNVLGKIDTVLHQQYNQDYSYWRQVLHRVLSAIKFLGTRSLAFRGTNEKFGSVQNGNYLGILELMAENDAFLKNHINKFGNPGKGNVCYLSKEICNEFLTVIYESLLEDIISELKKNTYYSISVDSTPDISHTDQLTFIVRYVKADGEPVERFIKFIQIAGHRAIDMEDAVISTLNDMSVDIANCRGQSYDNASNMSGFYGGLQAKIKAYNPLAVFVPCAAHSLNLVGQAAADCCAKATQFFMFVQHVYTFLSASTSRWTKLKKRVDENPGSMLPKCLSTTRWSARAEACRALVKSYDLICDAIGEIADGDDDDFSKKPCTRAEAEGLCRQFEQLETGIMAVLWNDILDRFDKTNKSLQSIKTDIGTVVSLYEALKNYVISLRGRFDEFEQKGKDLSKCNDYRREKQRRRARVSRFGERNNNDTEFDGKENMRIHTFVVVIDRIVAELSRRGEAYANIHSKFGFINCLQQWTDCEIASKCEELRKVYSTDLSEDFGEECIHFQKFIREMNLSESEISAHTFLRIIREKKIVATFPNMDTALRIFLTILSSNATGERSFSTLKRVKNYLRNTLHDDRLSSLAFMSANSDLVKDLNGDEIIDRFAKLKARKRTF